MKFGSGGDESKRSYKNESLIDPNASQISYVGSNLPLANKVPNHQ